MTWLLFTLAPAALRRLGLLRQRLRGHGTHLLVLLLVLLVALAGWRLRQSLLAQGAEQCRAQHAAAAASAAALQAQRTYRAEAEAARLQAINTSLQQQAQQLKKEVAHARILVPAGGGAGRTARPAGRTGPALGSAAPAGPCLGPDQELVLSLAAVRVWNAALMPTGTEHPAPDAAEPAGPGAAAHAAASDTAEAGADPEADADQPSGIALKEAFSNHINNALACRLNADRLDAITALLREWGTPSKGN